MAIFMLSGLLRQCSSSYENHPKFWIFLVMVRGWRRVFCYVTLDTACLKCCRPLGCLSKNESMPQVIPKLKDRQKMQSNVTWPFQVGEVEWCTRTARSQGSYFLYLIAAASTSLNVLKKKVKTAQYLTSEAYSLSSNCCLLFLDAFSADQWKEPMAWFLEFYHCIACIECLPHSNSFCLGHTAGWGGVLEVLGIRKRRSVTIYGLVKSSECLQCSLLSSWGSCMCLKTAECGTGSVPHLTLALQRQPQQASSKGSKKTEMRKEHWWYDLKQYHLAQQWDQSATSTLGGKIFPATCPLHCPPFRKEGTEVACHQCQQEMSHLWRKVQSRRIIWSLHGLLSSLKSFVI